MLCGSIFYIWISEIQEAAENNSLLKQEKNIC